MIGAWPTRRTTNVRAAYFEAFGPARDVLTINEIDTPVPDPGQVLVRLSTSGVNPSDVKKRAGSFPNLLDDGLVIRESRSRRTRRRRAVPSRRVWVYQAQFARRFGTAAEFVAIDDVRAPVLPGNASFEVGACLGIPAMTAHRCVYADGDVPGQSILITGGAGRVGYYAIQWAKLGGARVIATASNADDETTCRQAGADRVVNHRDEQFPSAVLDANGGAAVDRIVDVEFGANLPASLKVLRTGGTIATYSSTQVAEPVLPFFQMMYQDITLRFVIVYAMPEAAKQAAIDDITTALENDELQHRIAKVLPLDDIATGNEMIEEGSIRGAVLLSMD